MKADPISAARLVKRMRAIVSRGRIVLEEITADEFESAADSIEDLNDALLVAETEISRLEAIIANTKVEANGPRRT